MGAHFNKAQAELGTLCFHFPWAPPGRGGGVRGLRRCRTSWELPVAAVGRWCCWLLCGLGGSSTSYADPGAAWELVFPVKTCKGTKARAFV